MTREQMIDGAVRQVFRLEWPHFFTVKSELKRGAMEWAASTFVRLIRAEFRQIAAAAR